MIQCAASRVRASLKKTGIKCLMAVQETSKHTKELKTPDITLSEQLDLLDKAFRSLDSKAVTRQVQFNKGGSSFFNFGAFLRADLEIWFLQFDVVLQRTSIFKTVLSLCS